MKAFVATVHLLVEAEDEGQACDGVSELLTTACLPGPNEECFLKDWCYVFTSSPRVYLHPDEIDIPEEYHEGDFLDIVDRKWRGEGLDVTESHD